MKRLILSMIPGDFDPEKDIVAGPFCFLGCEDFLTGWESLAVEPDPFQTVEQIENAAAESSQYANILLTELADYLNKQNDSIYSVQFWRILIFPWLLNFVQTLWERYSRVENILKKYSDEPLSVSLVSCKEKWEFYDTVDFIQNGALNIHYNEWLFSRLIEDRFPEKWTREYVQKEPAKQSVPKDPNWKKKVWAKLSINLRCKGVYGINPVGSLFFSLLLAFKPALKRGNTTYTDQGDSNSYGSYSQERLRTVIKKYVFGAIPVCYLNVRKLLPRIPIIKQGKSRLISGSLLYHDESYKYFLGHCVEGGEIIIPTQHGCMYGTARAHFTVAEVEYKQYSFLTWGWKQDTNKD